MNKIEIQEDGKIFITPKFPLGTLFYTFSEGKVCRCVITEIELSVSNYKPQSNKPLSRQIWDLFWFKSTKEEKETLNKANMSWVRYKVSVEDDYRTDSLTEKAGVFTFNGYPICYTKEELLESL